MVVKRGRTKDERMAAAIANMDDDAACQALEHEVSIRLDALGASEVKCLMQSVFASDRQAGSLCNKLDKRARAAQYDQRWPAFRRTAENDPAAYESDDAHLPWYLRFPVSFVAARDAATLVGGLKTDFDGRGRQLKEKLGGNHIIGQLAVVFREDAQARLLQTTAAIAPLPKAAPKVEHAANAAKGRSYHHGDGSSTNNQMFVAFEQVDASANVDAGFAAATNGS